MFANLADWFDHRTGYRKFVSMMLIEDVPGGARWRYVWGSCLAFVFAVQLITGVLLMTAYSAGDSTAWSSVYYIQYEMDFGWLIRGLHHFGSQTMVVLLGLHMLQVVIAGAHLPPREINWWLGLALMGAVLGLSLTGYLLPWDQKGYWATQVATNIAGNLPGPGRFIQKIVVGGPEYGHHTLTRFYALHVGILPPLVIVLTVLHLVVFRRHGVTAPKDAEGEGWFWPDQAFKDLLVCLVIFGIMLALVVAGHGHKLEAPASDGDTHAAPSFYEKWAKAGREGRGANLDAPADPSKAYPARPEWYFLALFQLLKYFEGPQEIIGTVIIPNGIFVVLALLPLLALGRKREDGGALRAMAHGAAVIVVVGLLAGVGALTCLAIADDTVEALPRVLLQIIGLQVLPLIAVVFLLFLGVLGILKPGGFRSLIWGVGSLAILALLGGAGFLFQAAMKGKADQLPEAVQAYVKKKMAPEQAKPSLNAQKFQSELHAADVQADRAIQLASRGVPADGAAQLLRRDPVTQGKDLFQTNCASCHDHGGDFKDANGKSKATASDLEGFGTEKWVRDLLREPENPRFFGNTKLKAMTNWVSRTREQAKKQNKEAELDAEFDLISKWLGGHPRNLPVEGDKASENAKGWLAFEKRCNSCHGFAKQGGSDTPGTPDFTGYGDEEWLRVMMMLPSHTSRYAAKNTMPAFRDLEGIGAVVTKLELKDVKEALLKDIKEDEPMAQQKKEQIEKASKVMQLGAIDRELIIRWLLKDPRLVFGGDPIAPGK